MTVVMTAQYQKGHFAKVNIIDSAWNEE